MFLFEPVAKGKNREPGLQENFVRNFTGRQPPPGVSIYKIPGRKPGIVAGEMYAGHISAEALFYQKSFSEPSPPSLVCACSRQGRPPRFCPKVAKSRNFPICLPGQ